MEFYGRKNVFINEFDSPVLDLSWTFLRSENDFAKVNKGMLEINLKKAGLRSLSSPSFIGRRIESASFEVIVELLLKQLQMNENAGITLFANNRNHVRIDFDGQSLKLIEVRDGELVMIKDSPVESENVKIKIRSIDEVFSIFYFNGREWVLFAENLRMLSLNKYRYTGAFIGLYGSSNGRKPKGKLLVNRFEYRNR